MSKTVDRASVSLGRRNRAERRFVWYGRLALGLALVMLAVLLGSLIMPGIHGLFREEATLSITLPAGGVPDVASAGRLTRDLWKNRFAISADIDQSRQSLRLLATGYEREVFAQVKGKQGLMALQVPLSDAAQRWAERRLADSDIALSSLQRRWLQKLQDDGALHSAFHTSFLLHGDSRAPEKAGMGASIAGTLWVLLVTMGIALPVGILAAIYLEEFSRKNWLRDVIEVNINNLAAVPSIVFGLLGLAVYLNIFGMPRSSALAGGLTLALLVLPVIIIATRAALAAVPPSIKDGALALGASPLEVVWHHTFPLALPGILTGTILGMARAIGETAPLIMIGMVAFVADVPATLFDPASAMPVQIYLWAGSPEAGFADKTASGILTLLAVLLTLNAVAIILRRKTERRW